MEPINTATQEHPVVRQLRRDLDDALEGAVRRRRGALEALYPGDDSNLVAHAKRELELADLLSETSDYKGMVGQAVLDLVRVFAGEGHSGGSAHMAIDIFTRVARFDTLSPLTAHPAEWTEVEKGLWQSKRKPSVFWRQGEPEWYDLDAVTNAMSPDKVEPLPPDPASGKPRVS